jgi:hypothetical protein
MKFELKSPFEYTTPEAIPAKDIIDLFVTVFTEYYNVPNVGHTFVNGPRGCGKSMMFRYMGPDCQSLVHNKKLNELEYFAIHIPIKEGQLDKTDLSLLANKHGEALLNEHFMVVNFAIKMFEKLGDTAFDDGAENIDALKKYYNEGFMKRLRDARCDKVPPLPSELQSCQSIFYHMKEICSQVNREFTQNFIYKLICASGPLPYEGAICLFADFLLPLLKALKELPFMPRAPIYLLIDDADNLNKIQTKILNTWVSLRTSKDVSFKISTQLNYKTYRTINGSRIDTPHDYSEINISDIYTAKKSVYKEKMKEAVERRLKKFGYKDITAEDFFPEDKKQEEQIKSLFEEYRKKFEGKQGYDFAYRYARPDFMKALTGNLDKFSYAGFDSLVHISSGIMRHFIDFANRMYTKQMATPAKRDLQYIDPGIQDHEIKAYSNWFFDENFSKLREDVDNNKDELNDFDKLRNLIEALGETFHLILFSDATERRVFSFALQNEPDAELRRILKLGVQNGYFQKSLIGNKMGTGKARLYILNRLLAPHFKLDPTSFAGYKFVTCDVLKEALYKPKTVVGRIQTRGVDSVFENPQHSLFRDGEI